MSLVLNSSGGGSVTVQEPSTASNFTQTLPAATGTVMVSGNQPAFYVTNTNGQNISSATWTKVTLDNELFDTNNNFASSRFTPTVAGYYQINAGAYLYTTGATMTGGTVGIYKNGTQYCAGGIFVSTTGVLTETSPCTNAMVYCNGSADYVELYARIAGTSPVVGGAVLTFLSGCLVRTS